jgi:hypothetical protein
VSNKTNEIPKVRDIWILDSPKSPDRSTRFFMPKTEVLFQVGGKILKVGALGVSSRLVCWRLWQNFEL